MEFKAWRRRNRQHFPRVGGLLPRTGGLRRPLPRAGGPPPLERDDNALPSQQPCASAPLGPPQLEPYAGALRSEQPLDRGEVVRRVAYLEHV